jgi:Family of unknown function (DUF5675)
MRMLLEREIKSPDFTLGRVYIDGQFKFFSLEDTVREKPGLRVDEYKVPSKTAIPCGNYRVIITFSQRFQKHLPLLLDVPGFAGIRIHAGNTEKDTEGCILLGTGKAQGMVTNSRFAMSIFMPMLEEALKNGVATIEVR